MKIYEMRKLNTILLCSYQEERHLQENESPNIHTHTAHTGHTVQRIANLKWQLARYIHIWSYQPNAIYQNSR